MEAVIADTYRLVNMLKRKGFTEEQAGGLSEAFQQVDLSHLATKRDVEDLHKDILNELKTLELNMTIKLGALIVAGIGVLAALKFFG